jgi:hypothetical protein
MFSEEAKTLIGDRILSFDLDVVITGDITPLVDRPEDFVIWGGQMIKARKRGLPGVVYCWYNGSMMMLRAGTRKQVWDRFDPKVSPQQSNKALSRGSDQGWISYVLGQKEATWGEQDGVYSFRSYIVPNKGLLPANAKVVAFHGRHDPWERGVQAQYPWVREHYR